MTMTPDDFKIFASRPSTFGDFAGTFTLGSNDGSTMQYAVFAKDGYYAVQTNAKTVAIFETGLVGNDPANAARVGSVIRENVHTAYNAGIEYGLMNYEVLMEQRSGAQEGEANG